MFDTSFGHGIGTKPSNYSFVMEASLTNTTTVDRSPTSIKLSEDIACSSPSALLNANRDPDMILVLTAIAISINFAKKYLV